MSIRNISIRVGRRTEMSEYQTDTECMDFDTSIGKIDMAMVAFDRVKHRNPLQTGDDFTITGRIISYVQDGVEKDGTGLDDKYHKEFLMINQEELVQE